MAEQHLRRVTSATSAPAGIQWFVGVQFANREWYRDRTRVGSLLDALASTSWFREFDVFAPGIVRGTPVKRIDDDDWLCDRSTWDAARAYLNAERFTWAFADLRGHGRSRGQTGEFSVEEASADVIALADVSAGGGS